MERLTQEELIRYSRHLSLREFGVENQVKLKAARVCVVGAGGLGCPILLYLAAAGVGQLGIVDSDKVDITNLQRQVLYGTEDVGQDKTTVATKKIHNLNPLITLEPFAGRITSANALELLRPYDVIVDATDNFQTRYLLNDASILLRRPLVHGSILRFEGHVATFNVESSPGQFSACYRDLFPIPPNPEAVPNCELAGVLGVLPGLIGSLMALEVIKVITGFARPLVNELVIIDTETLTQDKIRIRPTLDRSSITHLIDYDIFCKSGIKTNTLPPKQSKASMKEITVDELKAMMDEGQDFQLIDVREPHETEICTLNGELIPMGQVPDSVSKIDRNKKVVIYCRSGNRSGNTIMWLEKNHNFENLYNLKGGILAWAREIDEDMETY